MSESLRLTLSPLRHLDAPGLTAATRAEVRARNRHLPPVSVYRWWARRTETVSGAIIDAVAADGPSRLAIADPFAGGGVIALAALLRGHQVYAQDINPWAAHSLTTMLSLPDAAEIEVASTAIGDAAAATIEAAYSTVMSDGSPGQVVHTLRVATGPCPGCGTTLRLYPTALASLTSRIDTGATDGYVACRSGHLQPGTLHGRVPCNTCDAIIDPEAHYTRDRTGRCHDCEWAGKLSQVAGATGFDWDVVLIERRGTNGREISPPTPRERATAAESAWSPQFNLPGIDPGVETGALLRHGMTHWHDLYPARQRVVLESLLAAAAQLPDTPAKAAIQAAVVGSVEVAGHASRWDPRFLKAYEAVASHRFSFTTLAVEPNVWGTANAGRGTIERRTQHLTKASAWLTEKVGRPLVVEGPCAPTDRPLPMADNVDARVAVGPSQQMCLPDASLDAIVTDPPFHDDVHYTELSGLFRAWAGQATGDLAGDAIARQLHGTHGTDAYQQLLTAVFTEARRTLRPGGHLILSYANREPTAWVALFDALQDAGFRAIGYDVVHSENEADHAKAGRRACTLDVLCDLVVDTGQPVRRHRPNRPPGTDEETFCQTVGEQFLSVGHLDGDWASRFVARLHRCRFLHPPP